ncbi:MULTISPECIES: hypothetical protein [Arthrobacter]|uniref:Uncharacterized protein n=1 Tax=Arthrobacter terricola TaxID=2547396 RepID=A0A4R5K7K4_9MICC|nr:MULTISPECIES: hypothetical protein [Arthrobacter]MBT8163800.1 hypothetical protein [Arthrobacter sp. GN70]TDF86895.1 hypothetical protein E1809_25410 [Arthrobacter terricola]
MAPGVFFGLLVIAGGRLGWAVARPPSGGAAKIRQWFSDSVDLVWWTVRGTTQVRVVAVIWIVLAP